MISETNNNNNIQKTNGVIKKIIRAHFVQEHLLTGEDQSRKTMYKKYKNKNMLCYVYVCVCVYVWIECIKFISTRNNWRLRLKKRRLKNTLNWLIYRPHVRQPTGMVGRCVSVLFDPKGHDSDWDYIVFLWITRAPSSKNSRFDTHIRRKVPNEARIEPPIHVVYKRSCGAKI